MKLVKAKTINYILPFILFGLVYFQKMNLQAQTGLFINEIQASNFSTLTDSDFNQFSDWIEIFNNNDLTINIGGYFLTDDLQDIQKWQFPLNTLMPPGEYYWYGVMTEILFLQLFTLILS